MTTWNWKDSSIRHEPLNPVEKILNNITTSSSYDILLQPFHGELEFKILYEDKTKIMRQGLKKQRIKLAIIFLTNQKSSCGAGKAPDSASKRQWKLAADYKCETVSGNCEVSSSKYRERADRPHF